MSKIECHCMDCKERFQRVVLQGEARPAIACPNCNSRQCEITLQVQGLFDGISNFSSIAKDTN